MSAVPPKEPVWLTAASVRMLHAETVKLFGGVHGLRDEPLLQSAIAKPRHLYTYGQAPTFYDLAAAYGYGLARNHPFLDGNKRTALLAIRAFLFIHGYAFQPEQVETVTMMEGVADGTMTQDMLAGWIRDNASPRNQQ